MAALLVPVPLRHLSTPPLTRAASPDAPRHSVPAPDIPADIALPEGGLADPAAPPPLPVPDALPAPLVITTSIAKPSPGQSLDVLAPNQRRAITATDGTRLRTVASSRVGLRAGPSEFDTEIDVLHGGDKVAVLYRYDGAWLKVRCLSDGTEGYVEAAELASP